MPKEIFYVIRRSEHQVGDNIYDFRGAGQWLKLTKEEILKQWDDIPVGGYLKQCDYTIYEVEGYSESFQNKYDGTVKQIITPK